MPQPVSRPPGQGRKYRTHAGSARHERMRRDGELRLATEQRVADRQGRVSRPVTPDVGSSGVKHCPVCGKGLTARLRVADSVHLERISRRHLRQEHAGAKVRPAMCQWTP